MKSKTTLAEDSAPALSEDDIRDYAFHLYEQSGCAPDRDLDNWLEARACLEANIPRSENHARLHYHVQKRRSPQAAERVA